MPPSSYGLVIHYNDVIMGAIASQITSLTIVFSTVYLDTDQRKHQSSASLAFVRGIHRRPVNSPHKWPVTRKMFPFDDVIMHWLHNTTSHVIYLSSIRILVTSYEHRSFANHQPLECLFDSLFRPTAKKTPKVHITDTLWGKSTDQVSNAESVSMSWCRPNFCMWLFLVVSKQHWPCSIYLYSMRHI